jgi:hypothetical protein
MKVSQGKNGQRRALGVGLRFANPTYGKYEAIEAINVPWNQQIIHSQLPPMDFSRACSAFSMSPSLA